MIELNYSGMCYGCSCPDLELSSYEGGMGETVWNVRCTHVDACDRMNRKILIMKSE